MGEGRWRVGSVLRFTPPRRGSSDAVQGWGWEGQHWHHYRSVPRQLGLRERLNTALAQNSAYMGLKVGRAENVVSHWGYHSLSKPLSRRNTTHTRSHTSSRINHSQRTHSAGPAPAGVVGLVGLVSPLLFLLRLRSSLSFSLPAPPTTLPFLLGASSTMGVAPPRGVAATLGATLPGTTLSARTGCEAGVWLAAAAWS